jgi:hypothetical protein
MIGVDPETLILGREPLNRFEEHPVCCSEGFVDGVADDIAMRVFVIPSTHSTSRIRMPLMHAPHVVFTRQDAPTHLGI